MIPSLAPCFTGAFLRFKDGLAVAGDRAPCLQGRDLLDGTVMEGLMLRFAETYPGGDRRALVSMWTQWHFGALLIPTVAAILLLDRHLPVDLMQVGIACHANGGTAAIVLPDEGRPRPSGEGRFSALLQSHVEPLVSQLSDQFRVSRRMLWTNAADIFEWTLLQAAATGRADAAGLAEGRALIEGAGPPHPMRGLVRSSGRDEESRRRKICCLRYLLPGIPCCGGICPTPPAATSQPPHASSRAQQEVTPSP